MPPPPPPPHPAEIANDLIAQARALGGRHLQGEMMTPVVRSLLRGADTIHLLLAQIDRLKQERGR